MTKATTFVDDKVPLTAIVKAPLQAPSSLRTTDSGRRKKLE